jgi:hypothetical protein
MSFQSDKNAVCSTEEPEKKMKTKVANSFGQFLKSKSKQVKSLKSGCKLDFNKVRNEWNHMEDEKKLGFKILSEKDKNNLVKKTSSERKSSNTNAKLYDKERKKNDRQELKRLKESEINSSVKFNSILFKLEVKYNELIEENSKLETELLEVNNKQSELINLGSKQNTEVSWKMKYKKLFEEHELCKKSVI